MQSMGHLQYKESSINRTQMCLGDSNGETNTSTGNQQENYTTGRIAQHGIVKGRVGRHVAQVIKRKSSYYPGTNCSSTTIPSHFSISQQKCERRKQQNEARKHTLGNHANIHRDHTHLLEIYQRRCWAFTTILIMVLHKWGHFKQDHNQLDD